MATAAALLIESGCLIIFPVDFGQAKWNWGDAACDCDVDRGRRQIAAVWFAKAA